MAVIGTVALLGVVATSITAIGGSAGAAPENPSTSARQPVFDPTTFVSVIDNPLYPLPVGRVLVYEGVRDGQKQVDTVTVTHDTKLIDGVTARVVTDIARTTSGDLLERTTDWFAQDQAGNVWYLGEDTAAYLPNGKVDTSGSWTAGVNGGVPGVIMEADPQIPDAYRQEYLQGQAEDTAWIVGRGGNLKVPYGTVHGVLNTLEHSALEPDVVDQKFYAVGLGIVKEVTLAGGQETSNLVKVTG
jgi:hypothetical protein